MIEFEVGEYDVRVDLERKEIELQNSTYKYVDLSFDDFEELYKKISEVINENEHKNIPTSR